MRLPPIAPHVFDEHVRTYFPKDVHAILNDPAWGQARGRITAAYKNDLIDITDALRMIRNTTTPGEASSSVEPARWLTGRMIPQN